MIHKAGIRMKKAWKPVITLTLAIISAAFFAGCCPSKADTVQSDTCFIYTDGLLDDLCAIEYLAKRYDNAVIMLQDPEGLKNNPYASHAVTGESIFFETVLAPWFSSTTRYTDSVDISQTDFYLLAPLTEYVELLKSQSVVQIKKSADPWPVTQLVRMVPVKNGTQLRDINAYRYLTENMTDLVQITRPACESEFEANGYPFEALFLKEYINKMNSMDENVCCYDLQAVSLYSKDLR